jgi:uncharacterized protein YkwD
MAGRCRFGFKTFSRWADASDVLPRLIAGLVVAGVLAFVELSQGGAAISHKDSPCGPVQRWPRAMSRQETRKVVLCLLNAERVKAGLPVLRRDARLELSSQRHSQDMVARHYFEHVTPEGIDPQARMLAAGYPSNNALSGENVAWATGPSATPAAIVRLWMHSPPHREDILRPGFVDIGVGVAAGAPETPHSSDAAATYATDFGGPPQR